MQQCHIEKIGRIDLHPYGLPLSPIFFPLKKEIKSASSFKKIVKIVKQ
jgi:hypothetical protein